MIKTFKSGQSDEILSFLHDTVVLLAANRYEEALEPISGSPYSPKELKEGIRNYFEDGTDRFVTPPKEATGMHPRQRESMEDNNEDFLSVVHADYPFCVCWDRENDDWKPLYAHADLPLNGSWEDQLTLKFVFEARPEGFSIVIEDIEVM